MNVRGSARKEKEGGNQRLRHISIPWGWRPIVKLARQRWLLHAPGIRGRRGGAAGARKCVVGPGGFPALALGVSHFCAAGDGFLAAASGAGGLAVLSEKKRSYLRARSCFGQRSCSFAAMNSFPSGKSQGFMPIIVGAAR